jgi:hypothetical protein
MQPLKSVMRPQVPGGVSSVQSVRVYALTTPAGFVPPLHVSEVHWVYVNVLAPQVKRLLEFSWPAAVVREWQQVLP